VKRRGAAGAEIPVVLDADDHAFDLRPLTADVDGALFARGGLEGVRGDSLTAISVTRYTSGLDTFGSSCVDTILREVRSAASTLAFSVWECHL
jgi:hypothetical protein